MITRHAGAKSHKGNCVDTILEVDEAAEMAGDISDDCGVATNEEDRNDKRRVSVENS